MSRRSSFWGGSSRVLACTFVVHVAHAATPEPEQTTSDSPPAPAEFLSVTKAPPDAPAAEPAPTAPEPASTTPSAGEEVTGMQGTKYRPAPGGQPVQLNLVDVSLGELIAHMSRLTGKRFIFDSKLKRLDVTVIAPTPVTVDEAYEAFLAILAQNGLNVVPHGPFLKVIESAQAARSVPPLQDAQDGVERGGASAAVITQLRRVENVSASDAAGVLESFKSPHGEITVYEPRGLLIITDTRAHVQRLGRLLEEIDVGSSRSRLWVQPVHYGQASEYAKQIEQVFGADPSATEGLSRVIADEATNSLIIVGHDDAYASLLAFLKRVDVAPVAGGRIHIVPLANAVAEELAQTLTRMLSGTAPSARGGSPGGPASPSTGDGATSRSLSGLFEGEVRVTADKPTNCLLVMSGAHDYAELRRVIDGLDRSRRQVFIEAVILEVAHGNDQSFGLDYHMGTMSGKSLVYGGLNPVDSITGATSLQALALGVRGPELEGAENILPNVPAGLSIPAFGVALTALAVRSSSDVLSTPHILTLDNTEAEINIGENIPLQINSAGTDLSSLAGVLGAAGGGQGLQNLGALGSLGGTPRQDVGTRIKITPHINTENQVRLEIEEEISEPGLPAGDLGAVSIVQRSARTTVVVDDEQTIVIGGLVRDTKTTQHEGLPLLSEIPVLGALFRKSTTTLKKTNLILILTPHVIDSQEDLRRVFARKMQERQEFLDRYFVFNADWQPPRDYAHANGLIEEIRQAQLADDERARLERDAAPRPVEIHEPTTPLELPTRPPAKGGAAAKRATPGAAPAERRTRQ